MDSKLRRIAILASMAVILLVSGMVFYVNWAQSREPVSTAGKPQSGSGGEMSVDASQGGMMGNDLSGFLRDDEFFDRQPEDTGENANRLSMVITSVEKDLRIQIVDMNGEPVRGESFYVSLDGVGEYKDLDKDGVIYVGGLAAGEYYVKLLPMDGYIMPVNETRIRVKDKVEYVAINDISLLLLTEADIDALAEDSAESDAVKEADDTEIQEMQKPISGTKLGIDISKWNNVTDWEKVKAAGVEFVIIRAGYRGSVTGALVEDPNFEMNIKGATEVGLPVGVYFFTQAVNEVEAVEEASAVLQLVADYELDYPIFIDSEGAGGNGRADGIDPDTRTAVCEAFCRTVENAGYRAGVYASSWWYSNNLRVSKLEKYFIWLAEYKSAPQYAGYYNMWQYTSKGQIDGIEGNVDLDILY